MRQLLRLAVSLALAVALLALLMAWGEVHVRDVARALARLDATTFALAFVLQAAVYPLRAARIRALLGSDAPAFRHVLPVTAAHILAANVLPAKLGEASVVVYLKRIAAVPAAQGLAVLLLSRLLDLATVAGALAVACLTLSWTGAFPELEWLGSTGGLLLLPAVGLAWASRHGDRLVRLATAFSRFARLDRTRLGHRVVSKADEVAHALGAFTRPALALSAVISLAILLTSFVFYSLLARQLGLEGVRFDEVVFGSGLALLANLLPINGFAGLGTQETGWVIAFGALGVPRDLAFESGLACHLVYLFNLAIFGLLGHLGMGLVPRRSPDSARGTL